MLWPRCRKHDIRPHICASPRIAAALASGGKLPPARPVYVAYLAAPERARVFAVAYLDADDFRHVEDHIARRIVPAEPYASDIVVEATIRACLAGETPLLIDRAARHARQEDFVLIQTHRKRMRVVCSQCLREGLEAAGEAMSSAPDLVMTRPLVARLVGAVLRAEIDPDKSINHHYGFGGDDIDDVIRRLSEVYGRDAGEVARQIDFFRYFYSESMTENLCRDLRHLLCTHILRRRMPKDGRDPFFVDDFIRALRAALPAATPEGKYS